MDDIIMECYSLVDDQQVVPKDVVDTSADDGSITASQERQMMDVYIPLDDCLKCRVELSRCEVSDEVRHLSSLINQFGSKMNDAAKDQEEDLFSEEKASTDEKEATWSWQDYFDQYEAAYPSCQQEEEDFHHAYYDENDFDPAIFLNASLYWIPR